jgi:hypothetical protein
VPRKAAEAAVDTFEKGEIEIVAPPTVDELLAPFERAGLEEERERLVARLAEIDAALERLTDHD